MGKGLRTGLVLLAGAAVMVRCGSSRVPLPSLPEPKAGDAAALDARGEYIVRNVAVCGQCHAADPKRNMDGPLSGGLEFRDWRIGRVRAANLTPDAATGLGSWSDAEIVRALRNGQRKDGRLLAPAMPYEWFHAMSDDDALAVARYLKSLPPAANEVRQSPSLVFKLGKVLFLRPKPAVSVSAPPRGATAEYGAYLAKVGLCADCHTPLKGLRSVPDTRRLFAGSNKPPKDFPVNPSNLTPDNETGIGKWTEEDFLKTLRTGVDPKGATLNSFMPWREIQRMTADDLRAIYRYLRTLPPVRNEIVRRPAAGGSPNP